MKETNSWSKKKSRNTGRVVVPDFDELIALMDSGEFLKSVDFTRRQSDQEVSQLTFAATDNCLLWIKSYCTPSSRIKTQLFIDMTYQISPFHSTFVSFANPLSYTSPIPTAISYTSMLQELKIPNADKIIRSILGAEFAGQRYSSCIEDWLMKIQEISDQHMRKFLKNDHLPYKKYLKQDDPTRLRPLKETPVKCMRQHVRIKTGLANLPTKFSNQWAEAINSVIKESIGKVYVDQV